MEKDKIFQTIQKMLSTPPLILIGTGGTIPYGISGMSELAKWLLSELDTKYSADKVWGEFKGRLNKGVDLETALTGLLIEDAMMDDIVAATWKLVSRDDLSVAEDWIANNRQPTLGRIIRKFYQPTPQCVNIITTNYDRLIEYACDQCLMPMNLFFGGEFIKRMQGTQKPAQKNRVNLVKVHGSLDWYYANGQSALSLPMRTAIPAGCKPAIVTPGTGKYKKILDSPFHDMLHLADELMADARNYLCMGYGFNDSQIQNYLINGIRDEKPIVVVTKEVSDSALKLIQNNSNHYVIIRAYERDETKTEVIMTGGTVILDEVFWTQDGFYSII